MSNMDTCTKNIKIKNEKVYTIDSHPTNTMWVAGTLELASKVRYGITSKGVPIYRFIPYNKSLGPYAVGCSTRDTLYNVHCVVEPQSDLSKPNELQRATLIQYDITDHDILMYNYAYDSQKELRKEFAGAIQDQPTITIHPRTQVPTGSHCFTFHIDPPGCQDADDAFTMELLSTGQNSPVDKWRIWIHIADVDAWIVPDSPLDQQAKKRATSFYTLDGYAISPMLPSKLSEEKASLKPFANDTSTKPCISYSFIWSSNQIEDIRWECTEVSMESMHTFTYDSFAQEKTQFTQAFRDFVCTYLGADPNDSHTWVQEMMILYNKAAGQLLKKNPAAILRRHALPILKKIEGYQSLLSSYPDLKQFSLEAAEFCSAIDEDTLHNGLDTDAYAYASSPLRRYADLINQRVLKHCIDSSYTIPPITEQETITFLNRRSKQAKQFSRDLFFIQVLQDKKPVLGVIISEANAKGKVEVFVPVWKRLVKVVDPSYKIGTPVIVNWFLDTTKARWKERVVFRAQKADGDQDT